MDEAVGLKELTPALRLKIIAMTAGTSSAFATKAGVQPLPPGQDVGAEQPNPELTTSGQDAAGDGAPTATPAEEPVEERAAPAQSNPKKLIELVEQCSSEDAVHAQAGFTRLQPFLERATFETKLPLTFQQLLELWSACTDMCTQDEVMLLLACKMVNRLSLLWQPLDKRCGFNRKQAHDLAEAEAAFFGTAVRSVCRLLRGPSREDARAGGGAFKYLTHARDRDVSFRALTALAHAVPDLSPAPVVEKLKGRARRGSFVLIDGVEDAVAELVAADEVGGSGSPRTGRGAGSNGTKASAAAINSANGHNSLAETGEYGAPMSVAAPPAPSQIVNSGPGVGGATGISQPGCPWTVSERLFLIHSLHRAMAKEDEALVRDMPASWLEDGLEQAREEARRREDEAKAARRTRLKKSPGIMQLRAAAAAAAKGGGELLPGLAMPATSHSAPAASIAVANASPTSASVSSPHAAQATPTHDREPSPTRVNPRAGLGRAGSPIGRAASPAGGRRGREGSPSTSGRRGHRPGSAASRGSRGEVAAAEAATPARKHQQSNKAQPPFMPTSAKPVRPDSAGTARSRPSSAMVRMAGHGSGQGQTGRPGTATVGSAAAAAPPPPRPRLMTAGTRAYYEHRGTGTGTGTRPGLGKTLTSIRQELHPDYPTSPVSPDSRRKKEEFKERALAFRVVDPSDLKLDHVPQVMRINGPGAGEVWAAPIKSGLSPKASAKATPRGTLNGTALASDDSPATGHRDWAKTWRGSPSSSGPAQDPAPAMALTHASMRSTAGQRPQTAAGTSQRLQPAPPPAQPPAQAAMPGSHGAAAATMSMSARGPTSMYANVHGSAGMDWQAHSLGRGYASGPLPPDSPGAGRSVPWSPLRPSREEHGGDGRRSHAATDGATVSRDSRSIHGNVSASGVLRGTNWPQVPPPAAQSLLQQSMLGASGAIGHGSGSNGGMPRLGGPSHGPPIMAFGGMGLPRGMPVAPGIPPLPGPLPGVMYVPMFLNYQGGGMAGPGQGPAGTVQPPVHALTPTGSGPAGSATGMQPAW